MNRKSRGVIYRKQLESPIGMICIEADEEALLSLFVIGSKAGARWKEQQETGEESAVLEQTKQELEEYFAGERTQFTIPVHFQGTEFQEKVWNALREIPYGETRTYGEIAERIGNPKACRAVGGANNRNPIMILTPCHRVIGADGSLVGFGGGLDAKMYLLALEQEVMCRNKAK